MLAWFVFLAVDKVAKKEEISDEVGDGKTLRRAVTAVKELKNKQYKILA